MVLSAFFLPPYFLFSYWGYFLVGCGALFCFSFNEEKPRERSGRRRFLPTGQKVSSYRGANGVPLSVCLSACLSAYLYVYHSSLLPIARAVRGRFPQTRDLSKRARVWANARDVFRRAPSRGCLLYTSPSPRDLSTSRMPSSA